MNYQTNENNKEYFAVIDTETTWSDKVMSIGIAIADASSFELVDKNIISLLLNADWEECIPMFLTLMMLSWIWKVLVLM